MNHLIRWQKAVWIIFVVAKSFLLTEVIISSSVKGELGGLCNNNTDCLINNSRCHLGQCACQPYYAQYNTTLCLQSTLLGGDCQLDEQCYQKVSHSTCKDNTCQCDVGYLRFRGHTCLGPAKPGEICYDDEHCRLWSNLTHCEYVIQNLYGRCVCSERTQHGLHCTTKKEEADIEQETQYPEIEETTIPRISEDEIQTESPKIEEEKGDEEEDEYILQEENKDEVDLFEEQHEKLEESEQNVTLDSGFTEDMSPTEQTEAEGTSEPVHHQESESSTRLKGEVVFESALKLLSKITKEKKAPPKKTTGQIEAKYREELEGMLVYPTIRRNGSAHKTQAATLRKDVLSKLTAKHTTAVQSSEEVTAVSLGLPCTSDLQCQTADPTSACLEGVCDCLYQDNETDSGCTRFNTGCSPDTFQCRSSGTCVSWFFVCDGREDCPDGSDELCVGPVCPQPSFQCGGSGICVSRSVICDGTKNCPEGEDEQNCSTEARNITGSPCPEHSFTCSNGQCVPAYEFCNATPKCLDGSDEPTDICRSHVFDETSGRTMNEEFCPFRCNNGRCRSTAIVCSGRDGCGDNSDEVDCRVCRCPSAP